MWNKYSKEDIYILFNKYLLSTKCYDIHYVPTDTQEKIRLPCWVLVLGIPGFRVGNGQPNNTGDYHLLNLVDII